MSRSKSLSFLSPFLQVKTRLDDVTSPEVKVNDRLLHVLFTISISNRFLFYLQQAGSTQALITDSIRKF